MSEKANKILYVVLSVLLAIVFWLFVDAELGNITSEDFTNVPVVFIGAEDTLPSRGLMLAEGSDATVDLRLSGPRSVIADLRREGVRVQINLTDISAVGLYSKTYTLLTPDNINISDITTERRSRSTITVEVTNLYSREIPVRLDVTGTVDDQHMHMAELQTYEPAAITVSGLRDDVDQIASARVLVDITGAASTIRQEYAYELLDAEGNVVETTHLKLSDQWVNVEVPIYMIKELPVTVKPRYSAGAREANVDVSLEPSTIVVAGDPLSLETIEEISLGELDLSAYITDYEDDLEIKLPDGCRNLSGNKTTKLSIRYHGLETKMVTVTNISYRGLSESQSFDLITGSVDVMLRGPAADLEQVTEDDVRIVADLTEFASDGPKTVGAAVFVDGYTEVGAAGTCEISGKIISR